MKTVPIALFLLVAAASQAQHSLEKIWEIDTTLAVYS